MLDNQSIACRVQEGWLSASGRLRVAASDVVEVAFDRFWVDLGSNSLRPSLGVVLGPSFPVPGMSRQSIG